MPLVAVGSQAANLSWSALVVGAIAAVMLGALQFVGHHRLVARVLAKASLADIPGATVVAVYYVGVVVVVTGTASAVLAQYLARTW